MSHSRTPYYEPDLRFIALNLEKAQCLSDLIDTANTDLKPRNFVERHLVGELAISKWRSLRAALMERAVYNHEEATFRPASPKDENGEWVEPNEDIFHLAMAHSPDRHAVVLAALSRLEARFQRAFHQALRVLMALRGGLLTPPEPKNPNPSAHDAPATPASPSTSRKEPQ